MLSIWATSPIPQREAQALEQAADIARSGRNNAQRDGVTEAEIDSAIEDAIAHVRHRTK